jgi:GT2 family glycosyltransferase
MLLNLPRLNKLENFNSKKYFDENIFLYLENDDLCKRVSESGENIYVVPKSKIKHLGAKAVDEKYKYEIELSRNWHWVWSKFYFNKKHYGFLRAYIKVCPIFISATFKMLLYFFINKRKKKIYLYRALGFLNAVTGKKSFYRPKINN